jgi:dienelactone hydrolase
VLDNELRVPGAEQQRVSRLRDLTTAGLLGSDYTDPVDFAGLHAAATRNPRGVAGLQIDGYFPDTSTFNTTHGWKHDAQFVIRLPDEWNGKLIVTGAPGVRKQYALDFLISDWVLARGYAFAATDKGNNGPEFFRDSARPGDAVAEWHARLTELTRASREIVRQRYAREPDRTYVSGISNGGYLTRYALERHPELYDGGVDWEGTLFRAEGPNLLTYLPAAVRHYPAFRDTASAAAHAALLAAGFPPASEFLWDFHYRVYWDLTQRIYRTLFDPTWDGDDAHYEYASRPPAVRDAVGRVSLSGAIGKPLITLHGTLDCLLPIGLHSDAYADLVEAAGCAERHRYYIIEAGNHVDGLFDQFPDRLRPILPCYRAAVEALEAWVEHAVEPPPSGVVPRPTTGDLVNTSALETVPRRQGLTRRTPPARPQMKSP